MKTFIFDQQEFNKDVLSSTVVMLPDLFYDDYENEKHAGNNLMDTITTRTDDTSVVVDPCIVATVIHNANSYVDSDNDE